MSIHAIEVVQLGEILPHPNADRMELTHVWGWQCCIGKGQFKAGDKAVYIPPDYVVPTDRPEFAFLAKEGRATERVKVRRLRGEMSQGLLIPLPERLAALSVGDDVMAELGIERYEPTVVLGCTTGDCIAGPPGLYVPKFDVENHQRFVSTMTDDEPVYVTEKIHGANAKFVFAADGDGVLRQFCGSRNNWLADDERNIWWRAFRACPAIGAWCEANPGKVLFGEVFGNVQSLKYGAARGEVMFAAFAVLNNSQEGLPARCGECGARISSWMDYGPMLESLAAFNVPTVPVLYCGPFNRQMVYSMAEADSVWPGADHMAEGVVVVPQKERLDARLGRVCLKVVSNRYLEA